MSGIVPGGRDACGIKRASSLVGKTETERPNYQGFQKHEGLAGKERPQWRCIVEMVFKVGL